MKISILVSGFPPEFVGGTEIQTYNMAKILAKRHEVTVFTMAHPRRKKDEEIENFHIRRVGYLGLPALRYFSYIFNATREIGKNRGLIDVLQCMYISPNGVVGIIAKKLFGVPVVVFERGNRFYRRGGVFRLITKFVLKRADRVLIQTSGQKKELLSMYPEIPDSKIVVVPNGIDPEFPPNKTEGKCILYLGRLEEKKGVQYLIEAYRKRGFKDRLLIIGDGPYRKELERLASGLNVEFAGKIPNSKVGGFLRRGKIFVLPSLEEGFPTVLLEAMSVGLPLISTRIVGMEDIVKNGENGFLVEPGNPDELGEAIEKLLNDQKLREMMGKRSLEEVKKYSWDGVILPLENIYHELVRRGC